MDTTRRKVMVVAIVVALLSVATVAVMNMPVAAKNTEINIIAQVNENGSAIVMKQGGDYCTIDTETGKITVSEDQQENWKGKVIGTPGPTTIQYVMLEQFIKNTVKLDFTKQGESSSNPTVYHQDNVTDESKYTSQEFVDGCIIWECISSKIVKKGEGVSIIDSKYLEKDHACCVIAAKNSYLESNYDATVRFLKGYVASVKDMIRIINLGSGTEYDKLIQCVIENAQLSSESESVRKEIAKSALNNVKYTYGEDGDCLRSLKTKIASYINTNSSLVDKVINEQGYKSIEEFTNELVDDTYLKDALTPVETDGDWATISIATITGDVHQMALHWGRTANWFSDNKISINTLACTNGQSVAVSLQNGEADVGFMGVPPITMVIINGALDVKQTYEIYGTIENSDKSRVIDKEVTFTTSNGIEYTGKTDDTGSFTITVTKGAYSFEENSIKVLIDGTYRTVKCDKVPRISNNYPMGTITVI